MTNKTEVITQKTKTMKNAETQKTHIRHKTQNNDKQNRSYNTETKTMKVESRDTENIRQLKQWRYNPETQTTLETRHRTITNKTEVVTQKTKTMKEESRETDNIRHKTQNEDKQNRSYNTEN